MREEIIPIVQVTGEVPLRLPKLPDGDRYRFHTMIKPSGAQCNLDCSYCFYLHKEDLLQQADVHGPDHATPVGATPLMLAAMAGNAPLVQALLDKGADPQMRDDFGHTAWDCALSRALQEPGFAATGLPAVFPLLAPAALDVQTDARLVRLERRQGEYWVLMLMLAGLKTQWSQCVTRQVEPHKYPKGYFAEQLHEVLAQLPAWLWIEKRRKRSYVNQVLARAEVGSAYLPARKLWVRARNGHYLPNPALQRKRPANSS